MRLRSIAHARSGDKGTTANISVIAFDSRDYARLLEQVTADRVKAWFADLVSGDVVRYELPLIGALNFVLYGVVGGGVTRTLALVPERLHLFDRATGSSLLTEPTS